VRLNASSHSLDTMTQISPTQVEPSNFPWAISVGIIGSLCAGLTFLLTRSVPLTAFLTTIIVSSLLLGFVGGKWTREPLLVDTREPVIEPRVDPVEAQTDMLTASMRFARTAIEATPNPVIILDEAGVVLMTNQAARARFAIGMGRARFANLIRRPDLVGAVESVLATKTAVTLAIETRVPVDRYERASVASFDVGNTAFVMVSIADETEARMSERMRADFLANASHELRTPLAAIIGFIETLRGPARNDDVARERFLEVMHTQADRMSRLISDLLSLSRIELNEHVAPTGHSDISSSVYEAVDGLQPAQKQRVVIDNLGKPTWVLGDRDEMAQVVINLIDNALKYSDPSTKVRVWLRGGMEREGAITFAMRQWDEAARLPLTSPAIDRGRLYGVLRVENDGDGIERQHLPRLSERFFRIEDTASGKSGTGLGLAIVKHIVSRHRGGLMVESELGRGAAFSVYLPQPFDELASSRVTPDAVT
jgi:two-component system, OmpR family, phosphate regulon sensor histidine kinase PhoR